MVFKENNMAGLRELGGHSFQSKMPKMSKMKPANGTMPDSNSSIPADEESRKIWDLGQLICQLSLSDVITESSLKLPSIPKEFQFNGNQEFKIPADLRCVLTGANEMPLISGPILFS